MSCGTMTAKSRADPTSKMRLSASRPVKYDIKEKQYFMKPALAEVKE